MKKFLIRVFDRTVFKSYGLDTCWGEIHIGLFEEKFYIPLDFWSIEEYEQQWTEGIERLKTYNQSCLVAAVGDPVIRPGGELWVLYKEGNKVYIQNIHILIKDFIKLLKKRTFTSQTCYEFIEPRETTTEDGMKISEWEIDLEDVLRFLDEKKITKRSESNNTDTGGLS